MVTLALNLAARALQLLCVGLIWLLGVAGLVLGGLACPAVVVLGHPERAVVMLFAALLSGCVWGWSQEFLILKWAEARIVASKLPSWSDIKTETSDGVTKLAGGGRAFFRLASNIARVSRQYRWPLGLNTAQVASLWCGGLSISVVLALQSMRRPHVLRVHGTLGLIAAIVIPTALAVFTLGARRLPESSQTEKELP